MIAGIHEDRREIWIDNTALQEFRSCPAKWQNRIHHGIVPARTEFTDTAPPKNAPLFFGECIHKALDVLYLEQDVSKAISTFLDAYTPVPPDAKNRTPDRGVDLLTEYAKRWQVQSTRFDRVIAEVSYRAVLGESQGYKVIYTGLLDKLLWEEEAKYPRIMDHKSTSSMSQATATSYEMSNQFRGYLWLARQNGFPESRECVVDLLLIWPVNTDFQRYTITMDDDEEARWKAEVLQTVSMIVSCYQANIWPRWGSVPCSLYNTVCPYFHVCTAPANRQDAIRSAFYTSSPWEAVRN